MTISLIQAIAFIIIAIFDFYKRFRKYPENGLVVFLKPKYGFSARYLPIPLWLLSIFCSILLFNKYGNGH
jgi:hypothetical protein